MDPPSIRPSEKGIYQRNQNPYLGFRGNVDGGQSLANGLQDCGIYAPPLARELQSFGYQAEAISGTTAPALLRQAIGVLGRPVEVWITHYLGDYPAINRIDERPACCIDMRRASAGNTPPMSVLGVVGPERSGRI